MNKSLRAFVWLLLLGLLIRSVDYVTGTTSGIPEDDLTTPEVWGAAGLVASVIVTAGLLTRKSAILKIGAITVFAIYTMIGIQRFDVGMLPYPWPPEDPRLTGILLTQGLMWLLVAVVVWWREYIERACEREAQGER